MTIGEGIAVAGGIWAMAWLVSKYFDLVHKTNVLKTEAALHGLKMEEEK